MFLESLDSFRDLVGVLEISGEAGAEERDSLDKRTEIEGYTSSGDGGLELPPECRVLAREVLDRTFCKGNTRDGGRRLVDIDLLVLYELTGTAREFVRRTVLGKGGSGGFEHRRWIV